MKRGGGKRKGSAFEREVCKLLSLWVSHGKRQDLFWRSAMSGGRATVRARQGIDVRQAGDITSVSSEGHVLTDRYYIETKCYSSLQIDRFIILGVGRLMKFWRETVRQARKYGRRPMLIAKQNGYPPLLITNREQWSDWVTDTHGCFLYALDNVLKQEFK